MSKIAIFPESVGVEPYRRIVIRCENGLYWTGNEWTAYLDNALQFASYHIAQQEISRLQTDLGCPFEFVAPIRMRICSEKPIELEELKAFLAHASEFFLDYFVDRPASLDGAIISSTICWDEIIPVNRDE